MDVSAVHRDRRLLCYSACMLGFGFYGDVIRDSEKKRWMGPIRYDFSGGRIPGMHGRAQGGRPRVPR